MLFNFIKKTSEHRVKLLSMLLFVITDTTSSTITVDNSSNDINLFYSNNMAQTQIKAATISENREYFIETKPQKSNSNKAPVINLRSRDRLTEYLHKSTPISYSPNLALNSFSLEVHSTDDNSTNYNNQETDELELVNNQETVDTQDNYEETREQSITEESTAKDDILLQLYDKITLLEKEVAYLKDLHRNNHERYIDIDQRIMSLHSELHHKDQQKNNPINKTLNTNTTDNSELSTLNISDSIYRAQILIQNKQYTQAIDILTKIKNNYPLSADELDKNPELFNVYFWIAEINTYLERYDIALVEFKNMEKIFKNHDRFPEVLYKIGVLYQAKGKIQESNNIFKTIVNKHPESSISHIANQILNKQ
jgi:TolA-binding protein